MAAGSTYTPIATTTLGSAQATVTLSSIPSSYTDLVAVINIGSTSGSNDFCQARVNGDTGSNYSATILYGTGSTAASVRFTNDTVLYGPQVNGGSVVNSMLITNFMNYSNTTTYKTTLMRSAHAGGEVDAVASLWRSTAAINSITWKLNSGANFVAGSTFTLYGIAAA